MVEVDDRIVGGSEEVAGADDVGLAEKDDAVAVGVGVREVDDLNTFAIEEDVFFIADECIRGPRFGCNGIRALRRAHAVEDVLVGNDLGTFGGIANICGDVAAGDGTAGFAEGLVAVGVVAVHVRVDDVADRTFRNGADRGDDFVGKRGIHRVDEKDAVAARLHRDVAAGTNQHVNVALHGKNVNFDLGEILILLGRRERACREQER
jgi:hypothetical protein